jgi:predicted nucleotidyltransferase
MSARSHTANPPPHAEKDIPTHGPLPGPARRWAIDLARKIIDDILADRPIAVYLFGSRAGERYQHFSDIDIALEAQGKSVPPELVSQLIEALEESLIPYKVDLVDLATTDDACRDKVYREGVKWRG